MFGTQKAVNASPASEKTPKRIKFQSKEPVASQMNPIVPAPRPHESAPHSRICPHSCLAWSPTRSSTMASISPVLLKADETAEMVMMLSKDDDRRGSASSSSTATLRKDVSMKISLLRPAARSETSPHTGMHKVTSGIAVSMYPICLGLRPLRL